MRLRLTVLDPASALPAKEIRVDAPSGTTFARIRPELSAMTGHSCFSVDGRALEDSDILGEKALLRGAILAAGDLLTPGPADASAGLVELRVVGGPGAGRSIRLGRGDHVLGRAVSNGVCLDDLGISRAHSVIGVRPDSVWVRDLEPTNASTLDDLPLTPGGAALEPTSRLRLGSTTVALAPSLPATGHVTASAGLVHIHRRPRFLEPEPSVVVSFPDRPSRPDTSRMPLLASVVPVVLAVGLAIALTSPAMLL